jgi:hypothetical protein
MSETLRRDGGRVVELFVPVEWMKATFSLVEIKPATWDQIIRWSEGAYPSSLHLLAEMSGMPVLKLRAITCVDVPRVMDAFLAVLPDFIADEIRSGKRPPRREEPLPSPEAEMPAGNGAPPIEAAEPIDEGPGFDARLN